MEDEIYETWRRFVCWEKNMKRWRVEEERVES
jgi:hypothetical protein